MFEASDASIGEALELELLFREPAIVSLTERGHFVYGRI
jgi:hypothetical protein